MYFIIIFQILLIVSLVRGVYQTFQSHERISQLQARKVALEVKHEELNKEMKEVTSPLYMEKVARDELHMSKPGETVVIVPDDRRIEAVNSQAAPEEKVKTNWQKWWEVLVGLD
jgi:cell division protein FtsB